jgi:hypothetical protein
MSYKNIVTGTSMGLVLLVLLSFIVAPTITSGLSRSFSRAIPWQNGSILDPNGEPLAILTLLSYVVAGYGLAIMAKKASIVAAIIAGALYALFQLYNLSGYAVYYGPVLGPLFIITAIVGLMSLGNYLGRRLA